MERHCGVHAAEPGIRPALASDEATLGVQSGGTAGAGGGNGLANGLLVLTRLKSNVTVRKCLTIWG